MTASEHKATDSLEGSFVGIGIIVTEHPTYINAVVDVYPNSPAQQGGILKGDIYAVNGQGSWQLCPIQSG